MPENMALLMQIAAIDRKLTVGQIIGAIERRSYSVFLALGDAKVSPSQSQAVFDEIGLAVKSARKEAFKVLNHERDKRDADLKNERVRSQRLPKPKLKPKLDEVVEKTSAKEEKARLAAEG